MKNGKRLLLILVVCVFAFALTVFLAQPFKRNVDRIEIKNGTTGEEYYFEGAEKEVALERLLELDTRISGAAFWTTGYNYKITLVKDSQTKEILIYSAHRMKSGLFFYEVDGDLIKMIEEIIKK